MAKKFRYPPAPPSGNDTFSPDLVGFQLVEGGGLTQGNFEFTTAVFEKVNRKFDVGVFSVPFTLENMNLDSIEESKRIQSKFYEVYPNYDITNVTNFTLYGSLQKRFSASVTRIINFFPAALQVNSLDVNYNTGNTAYNISYDALENETTFTVDIIKISNPLDIDYSENATRNISVRPYEVSPLRNMTVEFEKYALFIGTGDTEYKFTDFTPSSSLNSGTLEIIVQGNPFSGASSTTETLLLKPNKYYTEVAFDEPFDEVEQFLLNRMVRPKYTATFQVPTEDNNGKLYVESRKVTWYLDGLWNLDIVTSKFDNYLTRLNDIAENLDEYKTNLISRFLITGAFKEFDTGDQKVEKTLQIYGRSFDETKKFIDALAFMNSVNYNPKNDIPSELLKNLAKTLGFNTNNSPITNEDFLSSVFDTKNDSIYPGQTRDMTPREINYDYYRKLIVNAGWLYKSKGTRKSVEFLMRMAGAPTSLIEFNETVYLADGPINLSQFDSNFVRISGGTYVDVIPVLDPNNTYKLMGQTFSGLTTDVNVFNVIENRRDYPMDNEGYPRNATFSSDYFFEKGSGWFEQTDKHRANEQIDLTNSVFTGANPNVQTELQPYSYGEPFFDRFRNFPYMKLGYKLTRETDNLKSWTTTDVGQRRAQGFNAYYRASDERLVLNRKNVEIYLNMGQGLTYDVYQMSRNFNYPIPSTGFTTPYPTPGGIDWTVVNPMVKEKTFFEFAQTFYTNMVNVRNRMYSSGGVGRSYPTLNYLYWQYLDSQNTVNIPSNQYTYQKMIDFTNGIGDYWMRLVEQVIPATTLWTGGQKMENSVFHRQKVVWRRQRGCEIVPVPCVPCVINGPLLPYDCIDQTLNCFIYPWDEDSSNTTAQSFQEILSNQVSALITSSGYTTSQCNLNSIVSQWYVDLRLDNNILVQEIFYTGYGANDAPSNTDWFNGLNDKLQYLYQEGLDYSINNNVITISNSSCMDNFTDKTIYLNIGINITIDCGI